MPRIIADGAKVEIRGYVSERLYNELYVLLLDPHTRKPVYGSMSRLMEAKLAQFVKECKEEGRVPPHILEAQ